MENCLFCKIVRNEIPSTKVYEDDKALAFNDIDPKAPTHILIIPKKHIASVAALEDEDCELAAHIIRTARQLAAAKGLDNGFRLVVNTGRDGGQTVNHLHFHLLGGRAFGWPPG
ncbi:MAG: histidine triad nucleotide-binding protein [Christensenellales bacterium]|jgi:histidine triad (HIT) family protein